MIWLNPWAWLGVLFVAVPILVHLLSRRTARVQPFPTLRFLMSTQPLATRRTRITDPLLLAVRIGIITAAVAALAQPYLLTSERAGAGARMIARAIVIDTSASMRRSLRTGEDALDAARRAAVADAGAASASTIIEAAAPGDALAGAAAWLTTRSGAREIIVYSDFQLGAVDSVHLAVIPLPVGVQLRRSDVAVNDVAVNDDAALEHAIAQGTHTTVAHITASAADEPTRVEWVRQPSTAAASGLMLLAGDGERAGAEAAVRAAHVRGAAAVPASRPVALVFPQYDGRAEVIATAWTFTAPWMAEVATALRADPLLASAAEGATEAVPTPDAHTPWLAVAQSVAGAPVVLAAAAALDGRDHLVLVVRTNAGSSTTAALVAALGGAASLASAAAELEPLTLSDAVLTSWQRAATRSPAAAGEGNSDGRWLWLLAVALLAVEAALRRRQTAAAP